MKQLKLFLCLVMFGIQPLLAQTPTCTSVGLSPTATLACCTGLVLDATLNICKDPTIQDPALVTCVNDASCVQPGLPPRMGCYAMDEDDMFAGKPQNMTQVDAQAAAQDAEESARDDDPLPLGSACNISVQCESYSCVTNICVEKKICRYADEGEPAAPGIDCAEGLAKDASGKCRVPVGDRDALALGLLGDVSVEQLNQCQFKLDDEIKNKSIQAIKTMRAMEWLFATSSLSAPGDCFGILNFMRDEVTRPFYEGRKLILANFNRVQADIEADFQTLKDAKIKGTRTLSMHGETVNENDLATRQTSGYDTLMLMRRRNLLFQSYEQAMLDLTLRINNLIAGFSRELGNAGATPDTVATSWKDKSKKWKINGRELTRNDISCRTRKKKIRSRWNHIYMVDGANSNNQQALALPRVSAFLSLMSGGTQAQNNQTFRNNQNLNLFYLLDPLMPGTDLRFENYGVQWGGSSKRKLLGTAGSLMDMRNAYSGKIKDFYQALIPANVTGRFTLEPELPELTAEQARACAGTTAGAGCDKYNAFIEEIADMSFSQFIAYSSHSNKKYKKYFANASTWRRKLFAHYENDYQNISRFYETMVGHRDRQNDCIEAVLAKVAGEFVNQSNSGLVEGTSLPTATSGSSSGATMSSGSNLGPGSSAAANALTGTGSGGTTSGNKNLRISAADRVKFRFDLSSPSVSGGKGSTLKDSLGNSKLGSSSASGGSLSASAKANQAARLLELNAAKAKAKAAGVNVAAKEQVAASALENIQAQSKAQAQAKTEEGSQASLFGYDAKAQALEVAPEKDAVVAPVTDLNGKVVSLPAASPNFSGVDPGYGAGSAASNGNQAGSGTKDSLNDSDADIVMQNYERTKSEYQSSEEDPLFSRVSKAYVRNLEKILTRKKAVTE